MLSVLWDKQEKKTKNIPMKYYTKKRTNNRVRRAQKNNQYLLLLKKVQSEQELHTWWNLLRPVKPLSHLRTN